MAMLANDWAQALDSEFHKPYYKNLYMFVKEEYSKRVVYPPADDIFNAFHFTPLSKVKVLLLGQDPYHNEHQAHGMSFSVLPDQKEIPPSLQNIYQELRDDLGCYIPDNGYLQVGRSGRTALKYGTDRAGASGQFPSGKGLGGVYGRGNPCGERAGSADRLSFMGQACAE